MRLDGKSFFASTIAIGFIALTAIGMFVPIPSDNVKTVDGAMVALGTALGAAVMALLRNSSADETRAANTSKALDTVQAALNSTPPVDAATGKPGDPVHIAPENGI